MLKHSNIRELLQHFKLNKRGIMFNILFIIGVTFVPITIHYGEPNLNHKVYRNYVYDYTAISLGKFNVIYRKVYDGNIPKGCELEFGDNNMDNVVMVINLLNQITYVEKQPNPNIAFEYGGNCQAISLLADSYFEEAGIPHSLRVEKDHMYNTVTIDGQVYKLDIVNKTFKAINGGI